MPDVLRAPFPWFGGKSRAAALIWARLGADVKNYVEPFAGSLAILLGRPGWTPDGGYIETVNDKDAFLANVWRAIQSRPDETADAADWPVNEADLIARHMWLKERREELAIRLQGDPDYCDTKIAGWWLWGCACWIGSGFCSESGKGPWWYEEDETSRQLVHLGDAGRGVSRQLVHLGGAGQGTEKATAAGTLRDWFAELSTRLRRVRVACGDWRRILGPTPTTKQGTTAVVLDPPYGDDAECMTEMYAGGRSVGGISRDVRAWAIEHESDPKLLIALCGYDGEHNELESRGWTVEAWKARGGFGSTRKDGKNENAKRERVWFSPHCLPRANAPTRASSLFEERT